ncbi:asparagine synthase-related protein [Thaumasiovibrio subtropicus]|uniref:asparagine synthase-related protein n=1 Tax=Thaumasiovibrio subtropicus TaxID=1891207 RepID=UPI000B361B4F|nr:asparagine synthase-related protein [Thaumasiovibrio subtropicus]
MSIIAGIVSHTGLNITHKHLIEELTGYFQRFPTDETRVSASNKHAIFNFDFDAYEQTAWLQNGQTTSACVGHPLLSSNRTDDLVTLRDSDCLNQALSESEGAFCYLSYCQATGRLTLATDPLGLRPFYFMHFQGALIFSTQLKILKQLSLPLTRNLDGVTEFATLGYFLLDHTPYNEVRCARPGERLDFHHGDTHLTEYFDWVQLAQVRYPTEFAVDLMDDAFKVACRKYLHHDTSVVTTLSGGLDSRVIAAELQRAGMDITALNFSTSKTLDSHCAERFAQTQGIPLDLVSVRDTQSHSVEQKLGKHWRCRPHREYDRISRPQLAWSGNGGSVGIGMIYYSDDVYNAALSENVEALVDAYLDQQYAYAPKSVINGASDLQQNLRNNLIASFAPLKSLPLDKAYQLFLFLNDQHHHLAVPFEEIDEYQMEFCLPMYSWKVLQYPLSQPIQEMRKHKFYLAWLAHAYPQTLQSPWQAYPGHIPCPLPIEGKNQWSIDRSKLLRVHEVIEIWQKTMDLPMRDRVNRRVFSVQCLLHALHIRNSASSINFAKRFTYW